MEKYFDEVKEAVQAPKFKMNKSVFRKIRHLERYQDSGLWLKDYKRDEHGELPADLKRGVLSEDGLYNLLCDIRKCFTFR